jgi:hypothetical protein
MCGRLQTASFWSWNPTENKLGLYLKWKVKKVNSLFSKNGHMTPTKKNFRNIPTWVSKKRDEMGLKKYFFKSYRQKTYEKSEILKT